MVQGKSPFVAVIALCLAVVGASPTPARACSCLAPPGPREALEQAVAVFEGRVVEVEAPASDDVAGGESVTVRFRVTQAWKGVRTETVVVHTPGNSAACGYAFAVGESYLVYADGTAERLQVFLCSRTQPSADADEDRAALGAGVVPVDPSEATGRVEPGPAAHPPEGGCAGCAVTDARAQVTAWTLPLLAFLGLRASRRRRSGRKKSPRGLAAPP